MMAAFAKLESDGLGFVKRRSAACFGRMLSRAFKVALSSQPPSDPIATTFDSQRSMAPDKSHGREKKAPLSLSGSFSSGKLRSQPLRMRFICLHGAGSNSWVSFPYQINQALRYCEINSGLMIRLSRFSSVRQVSPLENPLRSSR